MTDKLREKAQQALGALEAAGYGNSYAAIELREALAEQAEQEPVAYLRMGSDQRFVVTKAAEELVADKFHELYAAPVRTKDLTDDEIEESLRNIDYFKTYSQIRIAAARAVIAADREKNK